MPIDVVFCLQCGLSVSLGLAAQSYLDSDKFLSKWLGVSLFFVLALSIMSLALTEYNFSLALQFAGGLAVSTVAALAGAAARLSKLSFTATAALVGTVLGVGVMVVWNLEVHPEIAKFFVSVVVFCCVCFWRATASMDFFVGDLVRAAVWSVVLFPVILMVSGAFFIVFCAVADLLTFPPRWFVNTVVFYGIFHS
jgi:hypothetical protein